LFPIAVSRRIGVTSAHDLELRYFLAGNPFVSGSRKLNGKLS
jgi:3-methyladenine DNA glycosylase Mpg